MRVLIVDTYYPAFLKSHYSRSPKLDTEPYAEQWRALMGTFFGVGDAYSHNLAALGHEAHEVVVNCAQLESAWAREHGLPPGDDGSAEETLLAQVRDFEPDVVYVQDVHYLTDETLGRLKRATRLLVCQLATEPPNLERLRVFDLVVTCLPSFVTRFNAAGIRTELLPLAFDERVLDVVPATNRRTSATRSSSARSAGPSIGGRTESSRKPPARCRSTSGATVATSGRRGHR